MDQKKFTGNTRIFLSISAIIIVVAILLSIFGYGMNIGIDFSGGSLLNYSVGEAYDVKDVETILQAAGYTESQITKAEPSDASKAIIEKKAAEAAAATEVPATEAPAADETADTAAETATEAPTEAPTAEPTEAPVVDKSGITDDGMYDLQIRLNLINKSGDTVAAIEKIVTDNNAGAKLQSGETLTSRLAVKQELDTDFVGGYVFTFDMGADYDLNAVKTALVAAFGASDLSVTDVSFEKLDAAALTATEAPEETAEATEAPAGETAEATEAPAEETAEATEAPAEEVPEKIAANTVTETDEATGIAVKTTDAEAGTLIRMLVNVDDETSQVRAELEKQMRAKYPNFTFVSIEHVSATSGKDLINNAIMSMLIVFVCLLIYIAIRFNFFSGVAALFGLLHDVLIMCAFMVFLRGMFQVNSPFIAALLTIVGYSINNTIIIFDRIRENLKASGASALSRTQIVEKSVASTIARTINTSLTTLFTLVALFIFGVDSIREFAFPLIVGMLAGTYSSVLLSGQVWAWMMDKYSAKKAERVNAAKQAKKA